MTNFAVVAVAGKQYLVKEQDELLVTHIDESEKNTLDLPVLCIFDEKGEKVELGMPHLKITATAEVLEHLKADKIRVAKFKSKVRYRKVRGHRDHLTRLKITKI